MSQFAVKTGQLHQSAALISCVEDRLSSVVSTLDSVDMSCALRIRASAALIHRLNVCRNETTRNRSYIQGLSVGLDTIASLYENYERGLQTPSVGQQETVEEGISAPGVFDWLLDVTTTGIDWVLERLAEGSGVFSLLSMLFNFSEGEHMDGTTAGVRLLSQFLWAFEDDAGGVDWFESFFGLNGTGIHGWDEAVDNFWDGLGLGDAPRTGAGTAAVVCRWVGYGLQFVQSGFDNYEEFDGDMSNARFWGETVIEGVVDVGVGAFAGVAAAALLPATWPAVAVGAVAGVAVWGADMLVETLTGGESDLSDFVANAICDTTSAVVDVVQDAGRCIVDGVDAFCDWVGSWW